MAVVTRLELAIRELLEAVVEQTIQSERFKTPLKHLENTLKSIKPVFNNESRRLNKVLERPETEITTFASYLEDGKELVLKCSRIKALNVYKKFHHSNKLIQLNNELLRFFQVELQTVKIDEVRSALTSRGHPNYSGSCSVPLLPDNIVGFDRHLQELKHKLLNDDSQVLVVSAPGGCGKTTLVKYLCHDKEIKDIYGENILYVTVPRSYSLKLVVQKLFEHLGENHRDFETDKEASNQLEKLMTRMGSDKVLLVLDDVVSESESIIWDLKFPIPGYKILVTSRCSFPRFNSTYELTLSNEEDARTLFCNSAFPNDGIPINVPNDIVNKIVKLCKGHPLTLTVIGSSLRGKPLSEWRFTLNQLSDIHSPLKSTRNIILRIINALDELPTIKECFLDMGLFPAGERIAVMALVDMWVELYDLDDEVMHTSDNLIELELRNLINLSPIRKQAGELKGSCNEFYVTQHDLLRDSAIYLSSQGSVEERKRLFIEIQGNQFPTWCLEQRAQPLNTHILSISTDESFGSIWHDLKAPKVEVLILSIRSQKYDLPQFIEKMDHLKVLSITSYGLHHSQLYNLPLIGCLSNLKRVRFERILLSSSIHPIFALENLQKLSFVICEFGDALMSCTTETPYMLPNLTDLEIDWCDLKELPSELCNVVHLKRLSITNCHEMEVLPKELGSLSNLENLRLHCCTSLQELPESIGSLNKLSLLDISNCLSISVLPENMGELCNLRVLKRSGCQGLQELPVSMSKLSQLEDDMCDKEMSLCMDFQGGLDVVKDNSNENAAPSIGEVAQARENSQNAGTDCSYCPPPSYSEVAPRDGSLLSDNRSGDEAPSIQNMAHGRENSETATTDFSYRSMPTYND